MIKKEWGGGCVLEVNTIVFFSKYKFWKFFV